MNGEILSQVNKVADICLEKSIVLTTAESCTGGGIAYYLTEIAGSSQWFDRSFVTYSNAAKIAMLGVESKSLETFGAVSQPVAEEMAQGALGHSNADVSISITGIAGPSGGTIAKPVGTCWIACANQSKIESKIVLLSGDRHVIREKAILTSLLQLYHFIEQLT